MSCRGKERNNLHFIYFSVCVYNFLYEELDFHFACFERKQIVNNKQTLTEEKYECKIIACLFRFCQFTDSRVSYWTLKVSLRLFVPLLLATPNCDSHNLFSLKSLIEAFAFAVTRQVFDEFNVILVTKLRIRSACLFTI